MRKTDEVVLWPVYFDSTKTKSGGRKVSKRLGCPSPMLSMIEKALQNLQLSYKSVPVASYPNFPWKKTGLVQVKKKKPKSQILKDVAKQLARFQV